MPTNPNILPLGYYMLFAMVDDIPSMAKIIRINDVPTPSDFDASGQVDLPDIGPFVNVLLGLDSACERVSMADVNMDGAANGIDVQPFVAALLAP